MSERKLFSVSRFNAIAVAALIGLSGCGGVYDAAVSGVVTLDDEPLSRGTVTFYPQSTGPTAYGQIQLNGEYSVVTGREHGLPPGQYVVAVVANAPSVQENPGSGLPPTPGKPISPLWYRDRSSTPLTFTVEGGNNQIDLPLTSEPPPDWVAPKKT